MSSADQIPSINFANRHDKTFGFEIISNREILADNLPKDYNPFRPHRLRYYALLFILEGEGSHYIDFKSYGYQFPKAGVQSLRGFNIKAEGIKEIYKSIDDFNAPEVYVMLGMIKDKPELHAIFPVKDKGGVMYFYFSSPCPTLCL